MDARRYSVTLIVQAGQRLERDYGGLKLMTLDARAAEADRRGCERARRRAFAPKRRARRGNWPVRWSRPVQGCPA
jgi:hypothetical protein